MLEDDELPLSHAASTALLGDNPIRPFHHRYEYSRAAELCSPLIQVCFRNPTGTGASPSRKDRDVFGYNLFEHFAQRWPPDRHHGVRCHLSHQVGGFPG